MTETTIDRKLAVEIAKDVLKWADIFRPTSGTYLYPKKHEGLALDDQIQKHLATIAPNCRVCALGACFFSYVNLKNEVTVEEFGQTYAKGMREKLSEAFSQKALHDIEAAFECWDNDMESNAKTFGCRYFHDNERLKAIMLNIIDNDGEFMP